ncbi:MAG: N-acetyltransferase family protein [Ginsengibacter sp.]
MIQIRKATEADLPGMLEIYNDIICNTTAVYDYEPQSISVRKNWFAVKHAAGFPVFVVEADGLVIGFGSIGPFRNWAAYKYSVENSIYVSAAHRGKGAGKLLLPYLIESASEMNMHTIIAGIDDSNTSSLRLHKSFGFEEVASFKQVGYKFNRWLNLKFLQLILPTPYHPE